MLKMGRDMGNEEVARLLKMVAAAYEAKNEDFFKIKAYENAATSIEHATSSIKDLWEEKRLGDIPGVGESLKKYLQELFTTGRVAHFEAVLKGLPKGMFELLEIPGVGPKSAYKLAKSFDLNNPKTALQLLEEKVRHGKVRSLEGFGSQSESELLKGIVSVKARLASGKRLLLPEAERLANQVKEYLMENKACLEVEVLGSLRRRGATVGDVDLAVKTKDPEEVMSHLLLFKDIKKVLSSGAMTSMFIHKNGRQVDVKTQSPEAWGSMLQHYTGSKLHNIHLRKLALKKGLSLSENGIKKGKKLLKFETEEGFYEALGMKMIPVEIREDAGEIEAAKAKNLPQLVKLEQIKGDLHIHTNIEIASSHDQGVDSVESLLQKAVEKKYEYVGFSDHNPKSELNLSKKIDLIKRRREAIELVMSTYEKRVKSRVPRVFIGLEVDIRPDGRLSLEDKAMENLDYVIASVHSSFTQDSKIATKRVLMALKNPKVKIFGHPTGRKLEERNGLDYDWEEIFEFCAKNGKLIEINGTPDRLDLSDTLIRQAIFKGVKMVIDSDSHGVVHMDFMGYGVDTARRGWAEAKNIANTLAFEDFRSLLVS